MKVLILGIDGLDFQFLSTFKDYLPNFRKVMEKSPSIEFRSVFPPDSSTAWASIYTGLEPTKHGVVFFKDPFGSSSIKENEWCPIFIEKAFWRIAEQKGKKVCSLYPFLPISAKYNQVYPPHLLKKYDFTTYEPLPLYSSFNLGKIINIVKRRTITQATIGLTIYEDSDWDLFFIYFPDLDNIEHIFWGYSDKTGSDSPYRGAILEMYKFFDKEVIGKFLKVVKPDTVFIILSDHGHTRRPINIVNINEILKRVGLLFPRSRKSKNVLSMSRKTIIKFMNETQTMRRIMVALWKFLPERIKNLYTNTLPIDYEKTIAVLCEPGQIEGLKTYNYAGIRIRKDLISEEKYEQLRQKIMKIISEIKDPEKSTKIIEWVCKREDLYSGKYIEKYPDIVFKLRDEWGVGADLDCPIFSKSYSYKIYSGMHKLETPVFLMNFPPEKENLYTLRKKEANLMDVAPTILYILDIRDNIEFDGESVLEKRWY
ncbi:MAG: alkaline phosphatase family protein [archaeon YNP-WB-062]|nr:alkaline phosphatase family protein [Candidatus Culexarchaeum yellowstonense]